MKRKTKKTIIALAATATLAFAAIAGGCSFSVSEWIEQATCDHVWNDGEVTKVATCTELGERTFTCTDCGKIETEEIEKIPHSEVVLPAVAATCTETGLTDGVGCAICGTEIVAQTAIPAIGHKAVRGEGVEATCLSAGLTKGLHCENCGEVFEEQEVIPAFGHNVVVISGYSATCTETGLTDGNMCDRCGTVFMEQETISALGHDYVNGVCVDCGDLDLTAYAVEGAYVDEELTHAELVSDNVYFLPYQSDLGRTSMIGLNGYYLCFDYSSDRFYLITDGSTSFSYFDEVSEGSIYYIKSDTGVLIRLSVGDCLVSAVGGQFEDFTIAQNTAAYALSGETDFMGDTTETVYRRKLKVSMTYGNDYFASTTESKNRLSIQPYSVSIPEGVTLTAKDGYMFMLCVLGETGDYWTATQWYESYTPKGGKMYGIVIKKTDNSEFDLDTDGLYLSDYIASSDTSLLVLGTTTLVHVFRVTCETWGDCIVSEGSQCIECGEIINEAECYVDHEFENGHCVRCGAEDPYAEFDDFI